MKLNYIFTYLTVALLLLFSGDVFGQSKMLSGVVVDNITNTPLQNATVTVKNSKIATQANEEGKFSIAIPAKGETSIIVSFAGYQAKTVTVLESENDIIVRLLNSEKNKMDEVVVVGVQRQSKRNTTSAISSVLAKDIENLPAPSVDQLLQGRVAGMNVQITSGEPGVAPTIVIRGNSKMNTGIGNDPSVSQAQALSGPLYVIDGIPINSDDLANNLGSTGTNFLAGINVNDIESVDVQKDAAATAAWGSRGANGVIYIKTKRGRSLKPEFRFNVYSGIVRKPELLTTFVGAEERQQKLDIINQYGTPANLANIPQILTDRYNPAFNNAVDWQGLFYRPGVVQNYDATISAATDLLNYRVSMNLYDEKGIIKSFGFKRYSLRGNFDFKINDKLNSQFIVGLSKSDRQRGRKFNNSDDNIPVSGSSQPSSLYRLTSFDSLSYLGLYNKLRNKNIDDYYSASLTVNYDLLPILRYTFQGSANVTASNRDYFQPSNIDEISALDPNATPQQSYALSEKGTYSQYFLSNTLNLNKKFTTARDNAHNIVFTASQQFSSDVVNKNSVSGYDIPSNDIQVVQGVPQQYLSGYSDYGASAMLSVLGQLQYDYNGKYLLYGSYRGDASSRFGANSKWGYFPAVGAGWNISRESFMEPLKDVVTDLKIRASYGVSGDNSSNFYAPYNTYVIAGNYGGNTAIRPDFNNGLTKNNLTWSNVIQKNLGIDLNLWRNRLNITFDAYDKLSKNGFYDFNLPFFTGFSSINFNARDLWISNKGYDLTIDTRNLSPKSKLQWNMHITLSHNQNLIAKLPNNNRTFVVTDWYGIDRIYAVGQPIYQMFQLKYEGVYNHQSEIPFNKLTGAPLTYFKGNHKVVPGDPKWADVNNLGDVWPDEDNGAAYGDRIPTGNPNPKFTGGWVNEFSYKNISLSVMGIFTWKRTVVNTYFQQQISNVVGGYSSNIYTFANGRMPDMSNINYWTPEKALDPNYKADFPSINPFGPSYYQYIPISSMFNEDGSYFKIKNITIGYQLPAAWMKTVKIKGARVYSVVDNIYTLKKGAMPNPELVDQLGVYTGGAYPTPTKVTLGIDIQF